MKILFVSNYFGYKSGFNKAAGDILYSLLSTNHEIAVLTLHERVPLPLPKPKEFKIIHSPWNLKWRSIRSIKDLTKWVIRSFLDLLRANYLYKIDQFNPDLIIVNSYSHMLLPLDNFTSCIKVFISHGSVQSSKLSSLTEYNVNSTIELLRKFNHIIFVSSEVRLQWLSFDELKEMNSYYIPNCTDELGAIKVRKKSKSSIAQKVKFSEEKFNVVFVANISSRKGHDIIVNEFKNHKQDLPKIVFHFIGSNSNEFSKSLIKYMKENKLEYSFVFHGVQSNALEFIYAADLLILPSRAEAFPLVLLESMVLDTPILASNVDGIVEIVKDKEDGLLFPLNDTSIFWNNLKKLYNKQIDTEILTQNANQKYWKYFSRDAQKLRFINTLDSIASNNR